MEMIAAWPWRYLIGQLVLFPDLNPLVIGRRNNLDACILSAGNSGLKAERSQEQ
jgi:hypothetical protein